VKGPQLVDRHCRQIKLTQFQFPLSKKCPLRKANILANISPFNTPMLCFRCLTGTIASNKLTATTFPAADSTRLFLPCTGAQRPWTVFYDVPFGLQSGDLALELRVLQMPNGQNALSCGKPVAGSAGNFRSVSIGSKIPSGVALLPTALPIL
jgi:hypothetical protein